MRFPFEFFYAYIKWLSFATSLINKRVRIYKHGYTYGRVNDVYADGELFTTVFILPDGSETLVKAVAGEYEVVPEV